MDSEIELEPEFIKLEPGHCCVNKKTRQNALVNNNVPTNKKIKLETEFESVNKNNRQNTLVKTNSPNKNNNRSPYSPPDLIELISRIEQVIPQDDNLRFTSRLEKIDWDEIAFGDYNGTQCRQMWEVIEKNVRRYRLLRELVEDAKEWVHDPSKSSKSSKTVRHPDMPRRPLTSYIIYYLQYKDKVQKENPGTDITSLSKQIAEMYRNLSPAKKQKYVKLAAEKRKLYEDRMEEFYRNHPEQVPVKQKDKKEKEVKSTNAVRPKKPCTPFKCFYEDKLKTADPSVDKNTLVENAKEQWKAMSDENKLFWIDLAVEQENKYRNEVKALTSENPTFVQNVFVRNILTKEEISLKERMTGKPEKPPNSAYSLFCRIMLGNDLLETVKVRERMAIISKLWKDSSAEVKNEYKERVAQMTEQYKLEYASYLETLPKEVGAEESQKNTPKKRAVKAKAETSGNDKTQPKKTETSRDEDTFTVIPPKAEYEGEPEQPPVTPFLLFAQKMGKTKPMKKVELGEMWSKLSVEEKVHYHNELSELKRKYISDYEQFLKGMDQDQLREYSQLKAHIQRPPENDKKNSESGSESENDSNESDCESESSNSSDQDGISEEENV